MTDVRLTREVVEALIQRDPAEVDVRLTRLVVEALIVQQANPPLPPSPGGGWGMLPIS